MTKSHKKTGDYIVGTLYTIGQDMSCELPKTNCFRTIVVKPSIQQEYETFTNALDADTLESYFTYHYDASLWNGVTDQQIDSLQNGNLTIHVHVNADNEKYYLGLPSDYNFSQLNPNDAEFALPVEE